MSSLSCSLTVTTVFAGELVDLENRLFQVEKKEAGAVWEVSVLDKVHPDQYQGSDS